MAAELRDGLKAGAVGFSTSRNPNHFRPGGEPVASRIADWSEVQALVGVMAEMNRGLFEISTDKHWASVQSKTDFNQRLKDLAVSSGRPITLGVFSVLNDPDSWRRYLELADEISRARGRMIAQVHSNTMYEYHTFHTSMPFEALVPWKELMALPTDEQRAAIAEPGFRQRLVDATREMPESSRPDYQRLKVFERVQGPDLSVAELVREADRDPVEVILDQGLVNDLDIFFRSVRDNELPHEILEMINHDHSVVTFSDSGAHVTEIADWSLQTQLLSHWVRAEGALSLEVAVRMLTGDIAAAWGLQQRGTLEIGKAADVVVFDPDRIAPLMPEVATDLPLGAKRLRQEAAGIDATVVNGEILLRDGEHTGALPGRVLKH